MNLQNLIELYKDDENILEALNERAGIKQFHGGMSLKEAEDTTAYEFCKENDILYQQKDIFDSVL